MVSGICRASIAVLLSGKAAPVATVINRYALGTNATPLDLAMARRMTLKYCELCGQLTVVEQRTGQKVCGRCIANPFRMSFVREEAEEIMRVADELRKERELRRHINEERVRYMKPREILHESKQLPQKRSGHWARWRQPLIEALQVKGELTAREMAQILGIQPGAPRQHYYMVPQRVRDAGIPIAVVRVEANTRHGKIRYYGLSQTENPGILPPQDPVTHKFMKEIPL